MQVIDLFAGCGGLSLGFQQAGFDIVAAFENWQSAVNVYQANFTHSIHNTDLENVDDYTIFTQYQPDMIIGGPPCQDFSSAGKRNENNGRGDLTVSFAEIVCEVKPQWFVMENVDRIITTDKLRISKRLFYNTGYGLTEILLDACFCGVPQFRKRLFLIGKLEADDNFLEYELKQGYSNKPLTVHDYLGDKIDTEFYYRHPRSYARRGIFSVYEPSPTIRGVNRPIPKGYKQHNGDATDDLSKVRPLTTKERCLIQTFSDDFVLLGCKTEQEQMIGNAVPVNLAKFVGKSIKRYVQMEQRAVMKPLGLFERKMA